MALKPFGSCPVCKKALSIEMVPIGKNKGAKIAMPFLEKMLTQIVSYTVESAIRAYCGSGRSLYFTCNNPYCTAYSTIAKPNYFKKNADGFTYSLVGDATGIMLNNMKNAYSKKQARQQELKDQGKKPTPENMAGGDDE